MFFILFLENKYLAIKKIEKGEILKTRKKEEKTKR